MRILLDVDGVVADMIGELIRVIDPYMTEKEVTNWDLEKVFSSQEMKLCEYLMKDPDFWERLKPYNGVVAAVTRLRAEHDVVFVSAPYWPCKDWTSARMKWLNYHFANVRFIATDHKHYVAGDVFVDDKLSNVEAWAKENRLSEAYLFNRPWNEHLDANKLLRLNSLDELCVKSTWSFTSW